MSELNEKTKADLFDEALKDKDIRSQVMRVLSKKHPDVYIPELAMEDLVEARTGALQKQFDDYKQAQETGALTRELEQQRAAVQAQYHISAAEMPKVEAIMTEKKIADYGSAAEFLRLSSATAVPTPSVLESSRLTLPDKAGDWFKDPVGTARKAAFAALNEINQRRDQEAA